MLRGKLPGLRVWTPCTLAGPLIPSSLAQTRYDSGKVPVSHMLSRRKNKLIQEKKDSWMYCFGVGMVLHALLWLRQLLKRQTMPSYCM